MCVFHFSHNPRHLSPCQLLYLRTCLLHTPFVNFAFVLLYSDHWSSHSSWEDSQAPSRTREWLTILGRKLSTRCRSKGEVATSWPPSQQAKSSLLRHTPAPLISRAGSTRSAGRLAVVQQNATLQTRLCFLLQRGSSASYALEWGGNIHQPSYQLLLWDVY